MSFLSFFTQNPFLYTVYSTVDEGKWVKREVFYEVLLKISICFCSTLSTGESPVTFIWQRHGNRNISHQHKVHHINCVSQVNDCLHSTCLLIGPWYNVADLRKWVTELLS